MPTRQVTSQLVASELEFVTSRSSGPGGQNVNKVNTKVTLRWPVVASVILSSEERDTITQKLASRITLEGELVISAQDKRSQLQNKEAALARLDELLTKAFVKKKKRKATKPSKVAVQKRIESKKRQGEKKKMRRVDY
ncbi:MAG: aminoacyl-tRNA hydrolase [Chryseotalea sp. WA131a]|nr:MAG: aminoacyl-tRNA hydrolase [Chryseotalea sp. WA131a]